MAKFPVNDNALNLIISVKKFSCLCVKLEIKSYALYT